MKLIKTKLVVTVTEVEGFGHEPKEGVKPEGYVLQQNYLLSDQAPSGVIDGEVKRMLVAMMPTAYLESEQRWAT